MEDRRVPVAGEPGGGAGGGVATARAVGWWADEGASHAEAGVGAGARAAARGAWGQGAAGEASRPVTVGERGCGPSDLCAGSHGCRRVTAVAPGRDALRLEAIEV